MVLDTAGNLTQVGQWATANYAKEQQRIALFLKLIRKNITALSQFPLSPAFSPGFEKFTVAFTKLEDEYQKGLKDPKPWAKEMLRWGTVLTQHVQSI